MLAAKYVIKKTRANLFVVGKPLSRRWLICPLNSNTWYTKQLTAAANKCTEILISGNSVEACRSHVENLYYRDILKPMTHDTCLIAWHSFLSRGQMTKKWLDKKLGPRVSWYKFAPLNPAYIHLSQLHTAMIHHMRLIFGKECLPTGWFSTILWITILSATLGCYPTTGQSNFAWRPPPANLSTSCDSAAGIARWGCKSKNRRLHQRKKDPSNKDSGTNQTAKEFKGHRCVMATTFVGILASNYFWLAFESNAVVWSELPHYITEYHWYAAFMSAKPTTLCSGPWRLVLRAEHTSTTPGACGRASNFEGTGHLVMENHHVQDTT